MKKYKRNKNLNHPKHGLVSEQVNPQASAQAIAAADSIQTQLSDKSSPITNGTFAVSSNLARVLPKDGIGAFDAPHILNRRPAKHSDEQGPACGLPVNQTEPTAGELNMGSHIEPISATGSQTVSESNSEVEVEMKSEIDSKVSDIHIDQQPDAFTDINATIQALIETGSLTAANHIAAHLKLTEDYKSRATARKSDAVTPPEVMLAPELILQNMNRYEAEDIDANSETTAVESLSTNINHDGFEDEAFEQCLETDINPQRIDNRSLMSKSQKTGDQPFSTLSAADALILLNHGSGLNKQNLDSIQLLLNSVEAKRRAEQITNKQNRPIGDSLSPVDDVVPTVSTNMRTDFSSNEILTHVQAKQNTGIRPLKLKLQNMMDIPGDTNGDHITAAPDLAATTADSMAQTASVAPTDVAITSRSNFTVGNENKVADPKTDNISNATISAADNISHTADLESDNASNTTFKPLSKEAFAKLNQDEQLAYVAKAMEQHLEQKFKASASKFSTNKLKSSVGNTAAFANKAKEQKTNVGVEITKPDNRQAIADANINSPAPNLATPITNRQTAATQDSKSNDRLPTAKPAQTSDKHREKPTKSTRESAAINHGMPGKSDYSQEAGDNSEQIDLSKQLQIKLKAKAGIKNAAGKLYALSFLPTALIVILYHNFFYNRGVDEMEIFLGYGVANFSLLLLALALPSIYIIRKCQFEPEFIIGPHQVSPATLCLSALISLPVLLFLTGLSNIATNIQLFLNIRSHSIHWESGSGLLAKFPSVSAYLLVFIMYCLLEPIIEEIFFRGLLQKTLMQGGHIKTAIVLTAIAYSLYKAGTVLSITAFIIAFFLGGLYQTTRSLWPAIVAHITINTGTLLLKIFVPDVLADAMLVGTRIGQTIIQVSFIAMISAAFIIWPTMRLLKSINNPRHQRLLKKSKADMWWPFELTFMLTLFAYFCLKLYMH